MSTSDVSGLVQEELKRHAQIPGGRVASFAFKRGTRAERTWVENYRQDPCHEKAHKCPPAGELSFSTRGRSEPSQLGVGALQG